MHVDWKIVDGVRTKSLIRHVAGTRTHTYTRIQHFARHNVITKFRHSSCIWTTTWHNDRPISSSKSITLRINKSFYEASYIHTDTHNFFYHLLLIKKNFLPSLTSLINTCYTEKKNRWIIIKYLMDELLFGERPNYMYTTEEQEDDPRCTSFIIIPTKLMVCLERPMYDMGKIDIVNIMC